MNMITKNEIAVKLTGVSWHSLDPQAQAIAQYAALVITNLQKDLAQAKGQQWNTSPKS